MDYAQHSNELLWALRYASVSLRCRDFRVRLTYTEHVLWEVQERLFWYDSYMRKLVMTQFKYIHEVCVQVGRHKLRRNEIVTNGAPRHPLRACETSAIINYYRFPPWPVLNASNCYRLCSTLI